jgi:hypothetical protein
VITREWYVEDVHALAVFSWTYLCMCIDLSHVRPFLVYMGFFCVCVVCSYESVLLCFLLLLLTSVVDDMMLRNVINCHITIVDLVCVYSAHTLFTYSSSITSCYNTTYTTTMCCTVCCCTSCYLLTSINCWID